MNEQLIKFIELCLADGVITDKEREVIFKKSEEFGISEDECEIILEGMIQKHSKKNSPKPKTKKGFFGSIMSSFNQVNEEFKKEYNDGKNIEKEEVEKEKLQNVSDDFESILDPSKSFVDPHDIIRHLNVSFKGNQNYYDINSIRELIKPKMFGTNIWNSTIREELIKNERTSQGKALPLGDVYSSRTLIRKGLWFGIIDGDEGVLFFPPTDYSPYRGFQSSLIKSRLPTIKLINGKKELLSGKPSSYYSEINYLILEIPFEIFRKWKKIYGNQGDSTMSYNSDDLYFKLKYHDSDFLKGRSSHYYNSSHEYKLSFNSNIINKVLSYIGTSFNNGLIKEEKEKSNRKKIEHEAKVKKVDSIKKSLFRRIDKDNNGKIDLFEGENEFNSILRKNQDKLQKIGDNYIHSFIRMENYLNTKRLNIEVLFRKIRSYSVNKESKLKQGQNFDLKDSIGYLENQIHLWNLLFFHSVNMLDSIIRDDKITFYEIYEKLDKLGIFNSNWENEVSEQLKNIEEGIVNLISKIQQMESNLISELQEMSYMNSKSINDLNHSVTQSLQGINSSINFNNLLTGIQTYQLYKINKNTKSLRG